MGLKILFNQSRCAFVLQVLVDSSLITFLVTLVEVTNTGINESQQRC